MATSPPPTKRQKLEEAPTTAAQTKEPGYSPYPNEAYEVGWITALPLELAAAKGMLDEEHGSPQTQPQRTDSNTYALGCIGNHKVVIACLPKDEIGASSAALIAQNMLSSFSNIRIGLMVGIGAGIPDCDDDEKDVHLGDVVISSDKKTGGVVAYNFGKKLGDGSFEVAYHLDQPPRVLRTALANLEAAHESRDNKIPEYVSQMLKKFSGQKKGKWVYPGPSKDILFPIDYLHKGGKTCKDCNLEKAVKRNSESRVDGNPSIHYGIIATGSEVVKHAATREEIKEKHNAICLEMEAAGLMNNFPCLIIRGISDYADSHKNDQWHRYAAASAAACAKELLEFVHPTEVQKTPKAAEIVGLLNKIEIKIDDANTEIARLRLSSQSKEIKEWLSAPDPEDNRIEAKQRRHEGTGLWFLQGMDFGEWKSGIRQSLWLRGIPGAGKTVLSSSIIDHLFSERSSNGGPLVLYFFFDTRDSAKQTLDKLLRSLISQLYSACERSRKQFDMLFSSKYENGKKQPSSRDLITMFEGTVRAAEQKIQIVLDALDECTNKEEVLEWIKALSSSYPTSVYLLITSRDEKLLESRITVWLLKRDWVSLQKNAIDADITMYIQHVLRGGVGFEKWNNRQDVLEKMQNELKEKANGMFRLVACQLDILKNCEDLGQVENALKLLPSTLEEVYDRILNGIEEQHRTRVLRILQFLVYAERPLRIEELVDAVAVDLSRKPEFEATRRMPDPLGILRICPSLITLASRDDKYSDQKPFEVIELAHATVKEYLMSFRKENNFCDVADLSKAHGSITTVCLAYLSQISNVSQKNIYAEFPLAGYSSRYWLGHARLSDDLSDVKAAVVEFLLGQETRKIWVSLYDPDELFKWNLSKYTIPGPLYYASLAGLTNTVTEMVNRGVDVNAQGGYCRNALHAASHRGHEQTVRLLLDKGADVNARGAYNGSPLQASSNGGYEQIVRLLLDKGADVNARGGSYNSALYAASSSGHEQIVRLLLDKGADVNAQGGLYGSALQAASHRGYEQIVRLLLDKGADINAQGGLHGNNALQAASHGGYEQIVRLLLDKGADVNAQGGLYGSAFQAASHGGHEQIVRLLLDKGADVNAQGGLYGSALQAASDGGHEQIVRLLLEKGADVNAQGGKYGNALQAALYGGHEQVVKLLINHGALLYA